MKRLALAVVAACALTAPLAPAAQASPAAPDSSLPASPLRFTYIQYDSPGNDLPPNNTKLNLEYVTIANPTSIPRVMNGWHVHDAGGPRHTYRFATFTLRAHTSVRLHTGKGTNTATNRYWGLDYYVWNNDGDTASLTGPEGSVVDTCTWKGGATGIHC